MNDGMTFDWRITDRGNLTDVFRIFTSGDKTYTDGSCIHNGTDEAIAGAGVHFPNGEYSDCTIRIPTNIKQTNQTAEIIGIKEAVETTDEEIDLIIHSDSKTCIHGLTKHLEKWENTGYIKQENAQELRATVASLRKRKAMTTLHWVKGHAGNKGNEKADELAMEGRQKDTQDELDLEIEPELRISGAKLKYISQSLAQKFIRRKKMGTKTYRTALTRKATICGIGRVKACAKDICMNSPTTEAIWKSIRHKDLNKKIRIFLWMLIHNGYKLGEYWENIPGYENRATCHHCKVTETMEHILTECEAPGQKEVWAMVKQLWERKKEPGLDIKLGHISGCGLADFRDSKGKRKTGISRLFRILISESAYLIWKLRCERVIGGKDITKNEIKNKWIWTIENRLNLDCLLTSKKFSKGKLSRAVVKQTWGQIVNHDFDSEGFGVAGVLVSIRVDSGVG
ncbi:ribonuclease H-like domain-containing protein [Lentinula lateritia]|uniref:ribonuclease H n=1 Tax=Lentinula lateritia TaxID=40482 RepID=A0ABQ8VJW4_9AGAR|nr:ribonuclease H-like domain-containing protein [Lentinula lateritia]